MKRNRLFFIAVFSLLFFSCQNPTSSSSPSPIPQPQPEPETFSLIHDYFTEIKSVKKETVPLYYEDKNIQDTLDYYYVNDEKSIPYLNAEGIVKLLTGSFSYGTDGYSLTVKKFEKGFILTRENGSSAYFDSTDNTITLDDFLNFIIFPDAENGLDIVVTNNKNGKIPDKTIQHDSLFHRKGNPVQINLSKYKIKFVVSDNEIFLPAQVVIDLFKSANVNPLYNENAFFFIIPTSLNISEGEEPKEIVKKFRDVTPEKRSDALKQFTYNELCLSLDINYGLKKEHNIESFDKLFIDSGLFADLFDDDAAKVHSALFKLTLNYFADKHSGTIATSPKALSKFEPDFSVMINLLIEQMQLVKVYGTTRQSYYPDGIKGYEEVGDTAFITFDSFKMQDINYYEAPLTNTTDDTLILIMYANQQIRRENSPIKKVVLDLSNNSGGECDTAVAVVAWMTGTCKLHLTNELTNESATTLYTFDANRDHNSKTDSLDHKDDVADLKLFCLTSPVSFSCGNLVPAFLKESDQVTLLGRTSGGGTCAVNFMSTADGTVFQISGHYKISLLKNGTDYDIDQGVVPHLYISDVNHFYDRTWLANYLDNLL